MKVYLHEKECVGLIVPRPSGVCYHNQVGGISCQQKSLEGIYIPLNSCLQGLLSEHFDCYVGSVTEEIAKIIDQDLSYMTSIKVRVDREKMHLSSEAWVFMKVIRGIESCQWCVLSWENSD